MSKTTQIISSDERTAPNQPAHRSSIFEGVSYFFTGFVEVDRALLGCLDFRALVVRLTLLVFSIRHSLSLQACQREREGN